MPIEKAKEEAKVSLEDKDLAAVWVPTTKRAVDYASVLGDNRVLFFGEFHDNRPIKIEIIENIEGLKRAGITHMALEMLEAEDKPVIDAYMKGDVSKDEISKLLDKCRTCYPGIRADYFKIIEKAKEMGLGIVPLDTFPKLPDGKDRESINAFFRGIDASYPERNMQWANIINEKIKENETNKVLVLCGSAHSAHNHTRDTALDILLGKGVKATSVTFSGDLGEFDVYDNLIKAATVNGINDERFMIKLSDHRPNRTADYVVHMKGFPSRFRAHAEDTLLQIKGAAWNNLPDDRYAALLKSADAYVEKGILTQEEVDAAKATRERWIKEHMGVIRSELI